MQMTTERENVSAAKIAKISLHPLALLEIPRYHWFPVCKPSKMISSRCTVKDRRWAVRTLADEGTFCLFGTIFFISFFPFLSFYKIRYDRKSQCRTKLSWKKNISQGTSWPSYVILKHIYICSSPHKRPTLYVLLLSYANINYVNLWLSGLPIYFLWAM